MQSKPVSLVALLFPIFLFPALNAQQVLKTRLADTGQSGSFTATSGEDADFICNPQSLTDNGNGTVTDNVTGLMWQKTDGGEMTFENAAAYCNDLVLGGFSDWRLPIGIELFGINNYDFSNPALNTACFANSAAGYWWTSEVRSDDATKVWVVNAGGGIGAHPKNETVSAGGAKRFHVRAVRNIYSTAFAVAHFTDNGDGTVRDNQTGLTWQKIQSALTMTWEEALAYAGTFTLAGKTGWRLPNIREIQSLNDPSISKPSFSKVIFPDMISGNFWSSTTLQNTPARAWDINTEYGIVSYNDKTLKQNVLLVWGGNDNINLGISDILIPAGEYGMGDHHGFVDPSHPSDEMPIHTVAVDSFYIGQTETTNDQYLAFLNASLLKGSVEVRNNVVYPVGGTDIYCYTYQFSSYYSISYDGKRFSMAGFRGRHPMVGVMWAGAAAYSNWLSSINGLDACYTPGSWVCDFTKNGYRLPTEAEWEWAGRGGQTNPYYNYPWGNDQDIRKANWPQSGDPYETAGEASWPQTTPVGFFDGSMRAKSDYNWPGSGATYQTNNGANAFGLYDMAGNVWEFVNDWYGQNYYSLSPKDNPTGPATGFVMPDGKPYRGMRGGNWYNGYTTTAVNDGHSRVSNRNPSYYRGPQDPNHPWYHVGFRVARKFTGSSTGISTTVMPDQNSTMRVWPNPFSNTVQIGIESFRSERISIQIFNALGGLVSDLANRENGPGVTTYEWNATGQPAGIYTCRLTTMKQLITNRLVLVR